MGAATIVRDGRGEMAVREQLTLPHATLRVARFALAGPVDSVTAADPRYRLNLCLSPRPPSSRGGFAGQWGPHRFEPIGDLMLVPPGHALHVRGEGGRQLSLICELAPEAVDRWLEHELAWTDKRLEASLAVASPHLMAALGRLAEEVQRPGLAGPALVDLLVDQVAIELARFLAAVEEGPQTGGLSAWRLRVVDERLRAIRSPPSLDELAALCGLSVRQLTRGFRASRGCSVSEQLARARIEGAKRMLLAGDESIKAVAFAMGFSSASSFAFAFRRATGVTPRHFRTGMGRATA